MRVLGLADFVATKKASGRTKDLLTSSCSRNRGSRKRIRAPLRHHPPKPLPLFNESGQFVPTSCTWGHPVKQRRESRNLLSLLCHGASPPGAEYRGRARRGRLYGRPVVSRAARILRAPNQLAPREPAGTARGLARSGPGPQPVGTHGTDRPITGRALRLCPAKRQGRRPIHRLHLGSPCSFRYTQRRKGSIDSGTPSPPPHLLRGLSPGRRRQSSRAFPQERLRQALSPEATEILLLVGEVEGVASWGLIARVG